jgi:hypothetical protein
MGDNELHEALICCNYSQPAPVHFKVRSRKELVRRGSSAVLRCQALGDLPITLTWRKEGSFVELQGRIRYPLKINVALINVWFLSSPICCSQMFYTRWFLYRNHLLYPIQGHHTWCNLLYWTSDYDTVICGKGAVRHYSIHMGSLPTFPPLAIRIFVVGTHSCQEHTWKRRGNDNSVDPKMITV